MQGIHLREYGVETIINFDLYEVDGVDLRIDAVDAGSDCNIRKDQGADATCVNDFVDEGLGYSLTITATEMEAKSITVYIIDSATKVWLDKVICIETYGHASAQHLNFPADLTHIMGSILTEGGAGRLKAAFVKLFDVVTPALVASDVMVGTDGANTAVPDVAGTAAGLHGTTDGKVDALNDLSAQNIRDAMKLAPSGNSPAAGSVDKHLDDIVEDTSELQTDDVPGKITTAQNDLDKLTGSDGATLATTQANYAPNKVVPDAAGTAPTAAEIKTAMEIDGGKLDHLWEMTENDAGTRRLTENALEEAPSGAGLTTTQNTALLLIKNIIEGDVTIDTTTTPWQMVIKTKSTDTELVRKDLKDVSGTNLTAIDTVIGQQLEPS